MKDRQYSSLRSQTRESQGDWALTWEARNSRIFALAGCPGAALAAGQGWSLSVRGDKSMEAVRLLTETQLSVVSLLLLILWKPLYFWGALGKWGAEVISEANAKTGRADTWGINGSRGPEESMPVGEVEQEQPQAARKRSAGMLVREGWLCLTLMEREKAGDSSVHCSHRLHCSGPCQSREDLVFISSQTCGLQRKSIAPKSIV